MMLTKALLMFSVGGQEHRDSSTVGSGLRGEFLARGSERGSNGECASRGSSDLDGQVQAASCDARER
jgi:hypothetical protein